MHQQLFNFYFLLYHHHLPFSCLSFSRPIDEQHGLLCCAVMSSLSLSLSLPLTTTWLFKKRKNIYKKESLIHIYIVGSLAIQSVVADVGLTRGRSVDVNQHYPLFKHIQKCVSFFQKNKSYDIKRNNNM